MSEYLFYQIIYKKKHLINYIWFWMKCFRRAKRIKAISLIIRTIIPTLTKQTIMKSSFNQQRITENMFSKMNNKSIKRRIFSPLLCNLFSKCLKILKILLINISVKYPKNYKKALDNRFLPWYHIGKDKQRATI